MTRSIYDLLTPRSVVRKTKFWDWFSGSQLNAYWNFNDIVGTGAGVMDDAIDGGFKITTGTTNNSRSEITFNDIRHYDADGSVFISVSKFDDAASIMPQGMTEGTDFSQLTATHGYGVIPDTNIATARLFVSDGSTSSFLNLTTDWLTAFHRQECRSISSRVDAYVDNILEGTDTTNTPTGKVQPCFISRSRGTTASVCNIKYLEAYNT